jgi:hypothetical protein
MSYADKNVQFVISFRGRHSAKARAAVVAELAAAGAAVSRQENKKVVFARPAASAEAKDLNKVAATWGAIALEVAAAHKLKVFCIEARNDESWGRIVVG